jgi:hypothetical protein
MHTNFSFFALLWRFQRDTRTVACVFFTSFLSYSLVWRPGSGDTLDANPCMWLNVGLGLRVGEDLNCRTGHG